mgnify:FL=1
MNLDLNEEHEKLRGEVQEFIRACRGRVPDNTNSRASLKAPETLKWQELLVKKGYAGRTIPKKYGGYGADFDPMSSYIIAEEFGRHNLHPGIVGQGISMLIPILLKLGSEEQKEQFIRETLLGNIIWCQGYSEPDAGSDLANLSTRATLKGDFWIINGQKIWTSTAHLADWMFCLVRTEPDAPKHKGISFLLFPMNSQGIEVRPLKTMTGESSFNEVFFSDVEVPANQIVGKRGEGWKVATALLGHERSMLGDPNVTQTRFNALVDLMKKEAVDGVSLSKSPVWMDRLMKIQGRMLALKYNDLRILSAQLNDEDASLARMIVKLEGTELRHDLEGLAIDALGELGTLYDSDELLRDSGMWQKHFMYYLGLIIGGGTSQIQKNIIGERGLGLPREPR